MFFCLLQLVKGFLYRKHHEKNGQVLTKPQMRLLLKNPGSTFLQIQTYIFANLNGRKECKWKYGSECVSEL